MTPRAPRKKVTKQTTDILEISRDLANSPLVKAVAGLVALAVIVFAALNANDNSTQAVQKSAVAVESSARALAASKAAEAHADRNEQRINNQTARIAGIADSIDSLAEGVERAVRRGIRHGIAKALRDLGN